MYDYDVIIVGCGPAGFKCALKLAEYKKKVLIVENKYLGGTCTNVGCIPTKSLLYQTRNKFADDYNSFTQKTEETIEFLRKGISYSLEQAKIELIKDTASIKSEHEVYLTNQNKTVSATNIVISTGSKVFVPKINGINNSIAYDSTSFLSLTTLPKRAVIIGGGVIGLELATVLSNLKCEVTILEVQENILSMLDEDVIKAIKRNLSFIKFYCNISNISINEDNVTYTDSSKKESIIYTDLVLNSCGRVPNLPSISEEVKISLTEKGCVRVNEKMQTNYENIYAIGDVTGLSMLAHSAELMGEICALNICGNKTKSFNPNIIPSVIYIHPEVSFCGLTEKSCIKNNIKYLSYTSNLKINGRFLAENSIRTASLIKVIAEPVTLKILGITAYCPYSSEMAYAFSLILSLGLTAYDITNAVFPHPSISEALKDACENIIRLKNV